MIRPPATRVPSPYTFGHPHQIVVAQNSPEWFIERESCHYTASEIPSLLGCGYDSPAALWRKKMGLVPPQSDQPNTFQQEAMQRGQLLEPIARARLDTIVGETSVDGNFWTRTITFDEDPSSTITLGASPDGYYPGSNTLLEIKCPMSKTKCDPAEDDRFWTYFVQQMCQCFCTNKEKNVLFIFHPELPCTAYLNKFAGNFWKMVVLPRVREHRLAVLNRQEPKRLSPEVKRSLKNYWAEQLTATGFIRFFHAVHLEPSALSLSQKRPLDAPDDAAPPRAHIAPESPGGMGPTSEELAATLVDEVLWPGAPHAELPPPQPNTLSPAQAAAQPSCDRTEQ